MSLDVLAMFVGDIGLDTTLVVDHIPTLDEKVVSNSWAEAPGGVAANTASAAHAAGTHSRLLCQVGEDYTGTACVTALRTQGVEVVYDRIPGDTGRAIIVLEPDGEKRLVLVPGVSLYPSSDLIATTPMHDASWVHTAPYDASAATVLVRRCQTLNIPWSLDLEPATLAGGIKSIAPCLDQAAVVFCNDSSAKLIPASIEQTLFSYGAKAIVRSRGSAGATWITPNESQDVVAPPLGSPVLDTTGAGDCLAGWFIAATLRGQSPRQALTTAVAAASQSCTRLGAQASYAAIDTLGDRSTHPSGET